MNIEITDNPQDGTFSWKLYTGPDSIDEYDGVCDTLEKCFEEINEWEVLNARNYYG